MQKQNVALLLVLSCVGCNEAADAGSLPPGVEASPDGEGYCCVPEEPSCDGTIVGGFIEEADEDCGLLQAFDYSPTSFGALMTDEHGCDYYDPAPGEACNPAPDAGP